MLDLRKVVKDTFKVTLGDGRELNLTPPKLKIINKMLTMSSSLIKGDDNIDDTVINELEVLLSKVLSSNKEKIKITPEYVSTHLDIEDMILIFESYSTWVSEIGDSKN